MNGSSCDSFASRRAGSDLRAKSVWPRFLGGFLFIHRHKTLARAVFMIGRSESESPVLCIWVPRRVPTGSGRGGLREVIVVGESNSDLLPLPSAMAIDFVGESPVRRLE